ncbi:MAG: tetratricopeptide repeat protein [Chloroflexi bacterium]|nr:tetratricopeptide repeat protein [Chloroflexota bacterium]
MLILFPLGFGLLSMTYLMVPFLWVLAALKRGDYEKAIRRSRWMEQVHAFRGAFLNLDGFALFLAGRYEKAQQLLQDSIRTTRRELAAGGADGLDNIGCVLTAQGQYDEAIKMFEGTIEISPKHVGAYNDLAQVYLFQGIEPQRALELTERALKNYNASFWYRWLERFNFGAIWASRAWALALLDRHSEAAEALEQAFTGTDRSFVPEFAGVHFRAGQTELLRGDHAQAVEHWEQACQLDPQGHYGGLAAKALGNSTSPLMHSSPENV